MPNWTSNSVIVSAKTEAELNEFIDFCDQPHTSHYRDYKTNEVVVDENDKGVFWNFVTPTDLESYFGTSTVKPTPEGMSTMEHFQEELATGMDWWHWNVRNWGTKWDISIHRDEIGDFDQNNDGDYYFHWYFQTAWSPAVEAYDAIAKRFPNLDFSYEITEEANFFAGILVYSNGELVKDRYIDNPTHEDFEELGIPCEQCGWAESGNCLDNPDEDTLELELSTTTQEEN